MDPFLFSNRVMGTREAFEMNPVRSPALASICIVLGACTNGASDPPPKPAAQPTIAEESTMPNARTAPAPLLEKVLEDAQKRTGASRSQLEIVSTEKITWNDGALGCPQPGRMYTQALVPGYRIRVRTADQTLDYHAAETGRFVLCTPQALDNGDVR
jgi:hypothetical protein